MKKMAFPKLVSTALLSTLIATATFTPAFAGVDEGSVSKIISNPLELRINVNEVISSDLISLTWAEGTNAAKEINTRKNKMESVTVSVYQGSDIGEVGEPVSFGVVLQVPKDSKDKIGSLQVDGENAPVIESSDGEYFYYVLKDGLVMTDDSDTEEVSFDIAFNSLTAGRSISANIFAVKDNAIPTLAPEFYADYYDGGVYIHVNPQEDLTDGTLVVHLPEGIHATTNDIYWVIEDDNNLTEDMISDDGRTITIPNITLSADYGFMVQLLDQELSEDTPYILSVQIDDDGDGTVKSMSPKVTYELLYLVPVLVSLPDPE